MRKKRKGDTHIDQSELFEALPVTFFGAYVLGALGSAEAIPGLHQALKTDKDSYVRGFAASALGKTGDKMAIPALEKALEDEEYLFPGKKVKDAAFEALEKIHRRVGRRIFPDDRRQMTDNMP